MDLKVIDETGQQVSVLSADDTVFGRSYNEALVHQVIVSYMSNARSGTRAQKNRSLIAKSTRKPWRQKGTGRARCGMASSPLWRGGGRVFPSSPDENFKKKINRKMFRHAMSCIYSQLVQDDRLKVVNCDFFAVDVPKSAVLSRKVAALQFNSNVLYVALDVGENLRLSARNLCDFSVVSLREVNPVLLLKSSIVILGEYVVDSIEKALSPC